MNAIIQAVASSNKLIEQFKEVHKNYTNIESLKHFVDLLQNVNKFDDSEEYLVKNTDLLKELIKAVNWEKPSQQDAFELLSTLVNGICKDLKNEIELPMKLKIVHQFKGINLPNKIQNYIGLSLGLNEECRTERGDTIENLIEQYFRPTIIDDDPNKTTQLYLYDKAPDVLLLHIQANKWDNVEDKMIKPEYHIIYDDEMICYFDIVKELKDAKPKRIIVCYKIKAVVQHMGNIDGGHYVTYRNWNDKWFLVNDEQVELMEFNNDICPYIMLYEKCDIKIDKNCRFFRDFRCFHV